MNVHDSEKVAGTLVALGYSQVDTPDEADLVLYNTCSIRDKAEQKVYSRLQQFKRNGNGRLFGVLGCVAQQEGVRIFERAPHVSLVCGSASYGQLPELLAELESGNRRVAGLALDGRRDVRDALHQARQPVPRLHHHHRGLRQVLRLLRGAVHARQGEKPYQPRASSTKRGGWRTPAAPRSSCWART